MRALQDVGEKYVKKAAREALKRAKEESVDEREERLRLVREKREVEKRVEAAVEVAKSATQDGGVRPAKRFLDESDDERDE